MSEIAKQKGETSLYKFYYKWIFNKTKDEGISECIVGANSEKEAIQYLEKDLENDDFSLLEILDSLELKGKGVLVSKNR